MEYTTHRFSDFDHLEQVWSSSGHKIAGALYYLRLVQDIIVAAIAKRPFATRAALHLRAGVGAGVALLSAIVSIQVELHALRADA